LPRAVSPFPDGYPGFLDAGGFPGGLGRFSAGAGRSIEGAGRALLAKPLRSAPAPIGLAPTNPLRSAPARIGPAPAKPLLAGPARIGRAPPVGWPNVARAPAATLAAAVDRGITADG